jgi:hypothetical protein
MPIPLFVPTTAHSSLTNHRTTTTTLFMVMMRGKMNYGNIMVDGSSGRRGNFEKNWVI